jgi:DNA-binding NarL/FixJ family response regulator
MEIMLSKESITTLVVDDDEFVLCSLPSFLSRVPSVKVVGTAKDGFDALEKIESCPPKMVVMDVRMPRMNGIEATEIIRKQFPDICVILTSGIDDPEMRRHCLASGAHAFMGKLETTKQFPVLVGKIFGN